MEAGKKLTIKTCQHLLNGVYSVSIFDNGDIMCKFCASDIITNVNDKKNANIVEADAVEMYHHLQKIYDEKAGSHDPDYPTNYLLVLNSLGVLPAELMRRANKIIQANKGKK